MNKLNKRVTIQQATEAPNTIGEPVLTWIEHKSVWAHVQPFSGREYFDAKGIEASLDIRVTIRYLSTVTIGMRVLYDGRIFDIQSVINRDESRDFTELMCKELIND